MSTNWTNHNKDSFHTPLTGDEGAYKIEIGNYEGTGKIGAVPQSNGTYQIQLAMYGSPHELTIPNGAETPDLVSTVENTAWVSDGTTTTQYGSLPMTTMEVTRLKVISLEDFVVRPTLGNPVAYSNTCATGAPFELTSGESTDAHAFDTSITVDSVDVGGQQVVHVKICDEAHLVSFQDTPVDAVFDYYDGTIWHYNQPLPTEYLCCNEFKLSQVTAFTVDFTVHTATGISGQLSTTTLLDFTTTNDWGIEAPAIQSVSGCGQIYPNNHFADSGATSYRVDALKATLSLSGLTPTNSTISRYKLICFIDDVNQAEQEITITSTGGYSTICNQNFMLYLGGLTGSVRVSIEQIEVKEVELSRHLHKLELIGAGA